MSTLYYVIAFAAGLGITLQTTLNSQLARGLGGDSVTAALFSFAAGAFSLGVFSLLRGGLFTSLAAIPSQPLWSLASGLIGACALFSYVALLRGGALTWDKTAHRFPETARLTA